MPSFAEGQRIAGRYVLIGQVSDDDITEVWTATDTVLARGVLVEVAHPVAAASFAAAAAAAARLVYPGVVATYDSGTTDGAPYVVTERPVGPPLSELLNRQGPIPAERVVTIGRQLARALEAAHARGVTHGAVNPEVVLVAEDDRVKLSRFASSACARQLESPARPAAELEAEDVRGCARTLVAALVGGMPSGPSARAIRHGVPRSLDELLVAAQNDPPGYDARGMAAAMSGLDVVDDAVPLAARERTPPLGSPVQPPPKRAPGSRTGAVAGVAVGLLLAVAIGVAAFVLNSAGGSNGPAGAPTGSSGSAPVARGGDLAITGASSFNPLGTGAEHPETLTKLYDDDPSTAWTTFTYASRSFGGLKPGDGVYVTLDGIHALHQLTVTSATRGWVFSVYVAKQPAPALSGWGQPVGPPVTVNSDVTPVNLTGSSGSVILIWITQLGATPPYQVSIGEVDVR